MLVKRIISSILLIGLVVWTLFSDIIFNLVAIIFIVLGLYEFFTMVEKKGISIYKYFGIFIGTVIPASIAFKFELTKGWEFLCIVLTLVSLIVLQFRRRDNSQAIVGISTTIFGILYISWFFSFIIKIRYLDAGIALVGALLLITKSGDIGAFLIGSRWGKKPLIQRISPKKSWEGAIGGLIFSVLAALACKSFLDFSYPHLLMIGIFLGFSGQLGDLSESLMKRDCQVKDSGNLIPGLGGILDTVDSLLFSAPAFYFYLSNLK